MTRGIPVLQDGEDVNLHSTIIGQEQDNAAISHAFTVMAMQEAGDPSTTGSAFGIYGARLALEAIYYDPQRGRPGCVGADLAQPDGCAAVQAVEGYFENQDNPPMSAWIGDEGVWAAQRRRLHAAPACPRCPDQLRSVSWPRHHQKSVPRPQLSAARR